MEYLNERLSKKKALESRTKRFAIAVFKYLDSMDSTLANRIIGNQLGRSASSIGANYREANRAESKEDFVHKLGITLKESAETEYWLDILESRSPKSAAVQDLHAEATELVRIFQSARRTASSKSTNQQIQSVNRKIEQSVNRQIGKSANR